MDYYALSKIIEERYQRYIGTTFYFKDPVLRTSFLDALKNNQITKGPFLKQLQHFKEVIKPQNCFKKLLEPYQNPL